MKNQAKNWFFSNFRVSTTNTGSTPVSCGVTEITDQFYSQTGHRIKRSYSNSMGLAGLESDKHIDQVFHLRLGRSVGFR